MGTTEESLLVPEEPRQKHRLYSDSVRLRGRGSRTVHTHTLCFAELWECGIDGLAMGCDARSSLRASNAQVVACRSSRRGAIRVARVPEQAPQPIRSSDLPLFSPRKPRDGWLAKPTHCIVGVEWVEGHIYYRWASGELKPA